MGDDHYSRLGTVHLQAEEGLLYTNQALGHIIVTGTREALNFTENTHQVSMYD